MNKTIVGAEAQNAETVKEIEVPNFVQNNNAKKLMHRTKSKVHISAEDLSNEIANYDATGREREIIEDLELILNTIKKYGVPDKIKLKCIMEYDSENVARNKKIIIKR